MYFVVCFGCGMVLFCFFVFFIRTHTACCKYEAPCLIYFSTGNILFPTGLQLYQVPGMHLCSLPTMEHISLPVRRHPQHSIVVQRSVRLIVVLYLVGYNTLKQGISLIKAVTALLRESDTINKAVTALISSEAASLNKAVIVLWHTTALLRDPYYCVGSKLCLNKQKIKTCSGRQRMGFPWANVCEQ